MELITDTAIVTGGASGIGNKVAEEFLNHGTSVAIADIAEDETRQAAEELTNNANTDARAIPVTCDISVEAEVEDLVKTTQDEFGDIGVLVNCAAQAHGVVPTWEIPAEDWRKTIDIVLTGTFLTNKAIANHMLENDIEGSIINISSQNAFSATDGIAAYNSAKAAIVQFTKTIAAEIGRYGIRVNAIAPGVTRTPMAAGFLEGEMEKEFLNHTPMNRIGEPLDQARVVMFLASPYSGWVTGETISVDGGSHIRGLHSYYDTMNPER